MDFIRRTCRKATAAGARAVYRLHLHLHLHLHAKIFGQLTCCQDWLEARSRELLTVHNP